MLKNILFIVNPIAGSGKGQKLISAIEERMEKESIEYEIAISHKPKDSIDIAYENADKYSVLVAVGGDGTINEVAKGISLKGEGCLGMIAGGTGNDLIKGLGLPTDINESLDVILRGNKGKIDIGRVNDGYFINIGSVGIDAEVIVNHNKIKKKVKGKLVYYLSVLYSLAKFKKKKMKIILENETIEEDMILVAVGNGKYYGGGFKILPDATKDDGYLDICLVYGLSKLKTSLIFPTVLFGKHTKYVDNVKILKSKVVEIQAEEELYINIDGEILGKSKSIIFQLEDRQIDIIA